VVSHQSSPVLGDLLASIERARTRARDAVRADVVVVDNASSDGSAELARKAGVTLLALDENVGFGAAANRALEGSVADWLVVLNPDLVVDDGFLEALADVARGLAPDVGILGAALSNPDGSPQPSIGDEPTLLRTLAGLCRPRSARKYRPIGAHARGPVDWVTGAAVAVRGTCWKAIGGFDPGFFLYYEDADLCRRARDAGHRTVFEPALCAVHLSPLAQRPVPPRLVPVVRYAQLRYFRTHRPRAELAVLALAVTLWSRLAPLVRAGAAAGEAIDWPAVRRAVRAGRRGEPGPSLGPAGARAERVH
jgi:GT2 family glycosyltransferase